MKKMKKILVSALSLLCVGSVGAGAANLMSVVADSASSDYNANFFTVSNGTLTATKNTSNTGTGVKLAVTDVNAKTLSIKYNDYISATSLSDAISFQVLPTTAGESDFAWTEIIFRDSVDESQVLDLIITKCTQHTSPSTKAAVALVDTISHDSNAGNLSITGTDSSVYGLDTFAGLGYTAKGAFSIGTWTTYYPLLAAEDNNTSEINVSFADDAVKVNTYTIADFANDYSAKEGTVAANFFTASTQSLDETNETEKAIKDIYNLEYVQNLFSSGKVSVELKFGASLTAALETDPATATKLDDVTIQINDIGGKAVYGAYVKDYESVSTDFTQPDGKKITASTGTYAGESTTNVGLGYEFSGNGSTFDLPGTYDFADKTANMGELIKLQVNPKNEGELAVSLLEIKFIDSENPYRYLDVVISTSNANSTTYGFTWNTSAFVTLVDSQTFFRKANHNEGNTSANAHTIRLFLNDGSVVNAISNTYNSGSYHAAGATIGEHSSMYPIMAKKAGSNTSTISVTYDNYKVKVNGVTVVNLLDSNFLNGSTLTNAPYYANEGNVDERISARYTEDYVKGLFASGKVKVQLKVNNEQPRSVRQSASLTNTEVDGSGTINVINLFGQSATAIKDDSFGFQDTVKPVISATELKVEDGKAYSVSELKAMFKATDNVAPTLTETLAIYNSQDVAYTLGETFTFSAGDYVTYTATDDYNNTASKTLNAVLCAVLSKTVNGETTSELVEKGATYAFTSATVQDKVFVGWEIGGLLYPANYELTVNEDISATAVVITFNMVKGASIRLDAKVPGIRWAATIGENDKETLGSYVSEWGVKVTSNDKEGYLAIPVTKWVDDGNTEFRCAMTELDGTKESGLYTIVFSGRAYAKITYANGDKATIWAVENDNARSISQVAELAYDDASDENKQILDDFFTVTDNT